MPGGPQSTLPTHRSQSCDSHGASLRIGERQHARPERPHTWSQSVSPVDAACLLKWISAAPPNEYRLIQFEVVDVLKGAQFVKRGDHLKLRRWVEGQKDSLFFMLGMNKPDG